MKEVIIPGQVINNLSTGNAYLGSNILLEYLILKISVVIYVVLGFLGPKTSIRIENHLNT